MDEKITLKELKEDTKRFPFYKISKDKEGILIGVETGFNTAMVRIRKELEKFYDDTFGDCEE